MCNIKYILKGGDYAFKFQCDSCGTLTEEGKPCPRCNHSVIKVYPKPN